MLAPRNASVGKRLAAQSICVVLLPAGMDVAAPSEIRVKGKIQTGPESIETWFDSFHGVMTDVEWKRIRGQVSEDLKLGTFRRHWCGACCQGWRSRCSGGSEGPLDPLGAGMH